MAKSVQCWLAQGDLPFGNPSSLHAEGRASRRLIQETRDYLLDFFDLPHYQVFFHSGATEGANAIIPGFAKQESRRKRTLDFFSAGTDHSCVHNLREDLAKGGHRLHTLKVNRQGDLEKVAALSSLEKTPGPTTLLNFTWVNNETGVVWDLDQAVEFKRKTHCHIHVDAVQSIGKIDHFWQLSPELDAYTFSAHKFGGMKGVGFTLLHPDFSFASCMRGGGQQEGLRSGTENVLSIYSIKLALQELREEFHYRSLEEGKMFVEKSLERDILSKGQGEIVGRDALRRNGNTILCRLPGQDANVLLTALDLAGIAASSGSACSTGAVLPSRVMMSMGYSEEEARQAVRFSFGPDLTLEAAGEFYDAIKSVLSRFL